MWEHQVGKKVKTDLQWKESTAEVCHFFHTDSPAFKCDLHHLPLPSKSFFLKDETHQHGDKPHVAPPTHKEYSLFKKGVFPDWEDPANHGGGCWYVRQYFPAKFLDHYWQSLVRAVVDEQINVDNINGIRIDDKSKYKHPVYKIEIWCNSQTTQKIRNKLRDSIVKVMKTNQPTGKVNPIKLHWRNFEISSDHEHEDEKQKATDDSVVTDNQSLSEQASMSEQGSVTVAQ